jgi:hypothetical protein
MIRSSTLLGVGRDDDRWSAGFGKSSTDTYFGGMVVTQLTTDSTGKTLLHGGVTGSQGIINATSPFPLGLVFEATNPPLQAFANGDNAAGNFDSSAYAKGGEYSVFHRPGNLVDVLDDQRNTTQVSVVKNGGGSVTQNQSAPFIIGDAWAVGLPVYYTEAGLLTITAPTTGASDYVRLGFVRAVSASAGPDLVVAIELNMQQFHNA